MIRRCVLFPLLMLAAIVWQPAGRTQEKVELPAALFQVWRHSHEEDKDGLNVYRPSSYNFPAARGRAGFEFKKDGVFHSHEIAPTDGTKIVAGTWQAESKDTVRVTFADAKPPAQRWRIVSCDKEKLVLRLLASPKP